MFDNTQQFAYYYVGEVLGFNFFQNYSSNYFGKFKYYHDHVGICNAHQFHCINRKTFKFYHAQFSGFYLNSKT